MNDKIFLAMGGVKQADGSWCYPQVKSELGERANAQVEKEIAAGWDGTE